MTPSYFSPTWRRRCCGVTAGQAARAPSLPQPAPPAAHPGPAAAPETPSPSAFPPGSHAGGGVTYVGVRTLPCSRSRCVLYSSARLPLCSLDHHLFCSREAVCSQDSHCGYPGGCSSQTLARGACFRRSPRVAGSGVTAGHCCRACAACAARFPLLHKRLRSCKPYFCISFKRCEQNRNATPSCTTITSQSSFQQSQW